MEGNQPLAELAVNFKVDLPGLKKDLDKAFGISKRVESDWAKSFGKVGSEMSKSFGKIGQDFGKSFKTATKDISKSFASLGKDFAKAFGSIGKESAKTSGVITKSMGQTVVGLSKSIEKMTGHFAKSFNTMATQSVKAMSVVQKAFKSNTFGASGGADSGGVFSWIIAPIKGMGKLLFGALSDVFTGVFQGLGQALYSTIQNLIVKPIVAAKDFVWNAIFDAGDAQRANNKFKSVFEDLTDKADMFAKQFAKKFGRGVSEVKDTMSRFQDTLVPAGFGVNQSASMSQTLTKLSGDLAVSEGIGQVEATDRLVSGMIGNHEALRRFGVMINETTLNAKLLAMGIKGGSHAATEQQKVLARLNVILEVTRQAQGAASRGAGSFQNAMDGMHSTFTDMSATIGRVFLPAATKVATFFRDLFIRIRSNLDLFGDADNWGARLGAAMDGLIKIVKPKLESIIDLTKEFRNSFTSIFDGFANATANWDTLKKTISGVWDVFKSGAEIAWTKVKQLAGQGFAYVTGGFAGILGISKDSISEMMKSLFDGLGKFVDAMRSSIVSIVRMGRHLPGAAQREYDGLSEEDKNAVQKKQFGSYTSTYTGWGGVHLTQEQYDKLPDNQKTGFKERVSGRGANKMPLTDALDAVYAERGFKAPNVSFANMLPQHMINQVLDGAKAGVEGFNRSNPGQGIQKALANSFKEMFSGFGKIGDTFTAGADIRRRNTWAMGQKDRLAQQSESKLAFDTQTSSAADQEELDFQRELASKKFKTAKEREAFIARSTRERAGKTGLEEKRLRNSLSPRELTMQDKSDIFHGKVKPGDSRYISPQEFGERRILANATGGELDYESDSRKFERDRVGKMSLADLRREQFEKQRMTFGRSFQKMGIDSTKDVFGAAGLGMDEAKSKAKFAGITLKQFAQGIGKSIDAAATTKGIDIANASDQALLGVANETTGRYGRFKKRRGLGEQVAGALGGGDVEFSSLEDIGSKIQAAIGSTKKDEPVVSAIDKVFDILQQQFNFNKQQSNRRGNGPVGDINGGLAAGLG